jgi:SAM-dependent methyltransferase
MDHSNCIRAHDSWAATYDSYDRRPFFCFLSDIMNHQITKHLPPRGRVLDAAGGTGTLAIALAQQGYDVVLTELSEAMIEVCRSKRGSEKVHIVRSDLTDMHELESDSFDASLCTGNAISYCDSERALLELKRVTKPESIIIFDVHSFYQLQRSCIRDNDLEKLARLRETKRYFNGDYDLRGYTLDDIERLVECCGLETVGIFGKMVLPNFMNTERMDELLSSEMFYRVVFEAELSVFEQEEYLVSALELGVVCRVPPLDRGPNGI